MPLFYAQLQRRFAPKRDGLTRREMLQATLAASAGLLLSSYVSGQNRPGKRILIFGAGISLALREWAGGIFRIGEEALTEEMRRR